jgi:hypothetical protein
MSQTNEGETTGLIRPDHPLMRRRRLLLVVYLLCVCAWMYGIAFGGLLHDDVSFSHDGPGLIIVLGVFVLMPILFLAGAPHWTWPRPRRRRSIYISISIGALMAGALTFGAFASFASLIDMTEPKWIPDLNLDLRPPWIFLISIGIPWALWLGIFTLILAGQWHQKFRRIYQILIAGTILELLVTIPIDVQVRRRTSCYCGEGTFFGLVIGLTTIMWTFGPGVALLFIARQMQKRSGDILCVNCGYDLRASKERCPECGTLIDSVSRSLV